MRIGAATAAWHFTLMTDVPELSSAADFPRATREQWEALVRDVLKGAPHERLITTTYDGLRIDPLYSQQPQAPPVAHSHPGAPWHVMQRVDHPEAGRHSVDGLPFRISPEIDVPWRASPRLGEDNLTVFRDLLGLKAWRGEELSSGLVEE